MDVNSGSQAGASPKVAGEASSLVTITAGVGSLCWPRQYDLRLFRLVEERRATYVTLGLLVVIEVLLRDSRGSGVRELATGTEVRWR